LEFQINSNRFSRDRSFNIRVAFSRKDVLIKESRENVFFSPPSSYTFDVVGLSGILKEEQKLGVNFNFDKQDVIDFTEFSKMTMCRASEANS
jgi:hypothetical protein